MAKHSIGLLHPRNIPNILAQGRHPFVYALAEFIDNSLRATSRAGGDRQILVSFLLSSAAASSSSGLVCVQDQGCGMSKKELNDWVR